MMMKTDGMNSERSGTRALWLVPATIPVATIATVRTQNVRGYDRGCVAGPESASAFISFGSLDEAGVDVHPGSKETQIAKAS
jgi:hypothetical protein